MRSLIGVNDDGTIFWTVDPVQFVRQKALDVVCKATAWSLKLLIGIRRRWVKTWALMTSRKKRWQTHSRRLGVTKPSPRVPSISIEREREWGLGFGSERSHPYRSPSMGRGAGGPYRRRKGLPPPPPFGRSPSPLRRVRMAAPLAGAEADDRRSGWTKACARRRTYSSPHRNSAPLYTTTPTDAISAFHGAIRHANLRSAHKPGTHL